MESQNVYISSTMIIGAIFSIVAFVLISLMALIGWGLRNAFTDYKKDRDEVKKTLVEDKLEIRKSLAEDKNSFETKIEKLASAFGNELKAVGHEFMTQVKDVKTELASLSKAMSDLARVVTETKNESSLRYDNHEKRIDELHKRIETVSAKGHEVGNSAQKAEFGVAGNTRRLDILEKIIISASILPTRKTPSEDPSYVHPEEKKST